MEILEDINIACTISGFENPTLPFLEKSLNLDEIFVANPSSTRIIAAPNQVLSRGVDKGDWLLVNSSLAPKQSDLLYAMSNGECGLVTYETAMRASERSDCIEIVGVVQQSIHFYRGAEDIPEHSNLNDVTLHELLVEKEHATIIARATGESMLPYVHTNDFMLIERHLDYRHYDVCVVALNGDLVLKRLNLAARSLQSDNPSFKPHFIQQSDRITIEGVCNKVFRLHRKA